MTEKYFKIDSFGIYEGDYLHRLDRLMIYRRLNELYYENKELKREREKFKEWEKHIGDVKREELDRVFKMSIYEIAEAFKYYKERIEKLERS